MARRDITGAIDFAYLEAYAAGDAALVDEVLALFEQQAGTWSRLLDPAREGWRDAAHTLKGAAAGIGARTLAEACGEAEAHGGHARLEAVRDALDLALADVAAYRHEQLLRGLKTP